MPSLRSDERSSVQLALRLFLFVLTALFALEWGFAYLHRHAVYPWNSPIFNPLFRLSDWLDYLPRAQHFGEPGFLTKDGPGRGLHFAYPVTCLYVYLAFVKLFAHPTSAYIRFTLLVFTGAGALFSVYLGRIRATLPFQLCAWATVLLGSPALFLLDRGNFEVFIWIFLAGGIASFIQDWKYLAATCFAIAACLKIYPAIFFLLFVKRRQFLPLLTSLVLTGLLFAAAVAGVNAASPGAQKDMSANAREMQNLQLAQSSQLNLRWDHSLFAEEKQTVYLFEVLTHRIRKQDPPAFFGSLRAYSILIPLAFLVLYLFRLRHLPLLNQFATLTICSVTLPFVSYEYTLVHLYLVWAVFLVFLYQNVITQQVSLSQRTLLTIAFSFALIFAPLALTALEHFTGQIKGFFLVLLLVIFSSVPMPSSIFGDLIHMAPDREDTLKESFASE